MDIKSRILSKVYQPIWHHVCTDRYGEPHYCTSAQMDNEVKSDRFFRAVRKETGIKIKNDVPLGEELSEEDYTMFIRWALSVKNWRDEKGNQPYTLKESSKLETQ